MSAFFLHGYIYHMVRHLWPFIITPCRFYPDVMSPLNTFPDRCVLQICRWNTQRGRKQREQSPLNGLGRFLQQRLICKHSEVSNFNTWLREKCRLTNKWSGILFSCYLVMFFIWKMWYFLFSSPGQHPAESQEMLFNILFIL